MLIELAEDRRSPREPVEEGLLHQALAVVERPRHAHGGDVTADGGHLRFLERRDLPGRIQDHHPHARARRGTPVPRRSRCRRRSPRAPWRRRRARQGGAEEAGEEPCAEVLERQRRSVEELEDREAGPTATTGAGKLNASRSGVRAVPRSNSSPTRCDTSGRRAGNRQATPRRERLVLDRRNRRGRYRPPSGARPPSSASRKVTGGASRLVLTRIMRSSTRQAPAVFTGPT